MKTKVSGSGRQVRESGELDSGSGSDAVSRQQLIAEAACFRAEQRGFVPGNELSDWLDAEADMEHMLGNRPAVSNIT